MKVKTTVQTVELTGVDLDWAVYQCEFAKWDDYEDALYSDDWYDGAPMPPRPSEYVNDYSYTTGCDFKPSIDWAYGGPIIEREELVVTPVEFITDQPWHCYSNVYGGDGAYGKTMLEAAMRCYVLNTLGSFVDTKVTPLTSRIR